MSSKRYPSRLESRAGFFASTRDECLSPRVRLECNPEIPVAPGEEHWLLDTSLESFSGSKMLAREVKTWGERLIALLLVKRLWLRSSKSDSNDSNKPKRKKETCRLGAEFGHDLTRRPPSICFSVTSAPPTQLGPTPGSLHHGKICRSSRLHVPRPQC